MVTTLLVGLASLWSVVVVDVLAETVSSGGARIFFLAQPSAPLAPGREVLVLAALAASAAGGLAVALMSLRSRHIERRMAAELDAQWEEISRREALAKAQHDQSGPSQFLEWRRDALLEEIQQLRGRAAALREATLKQQAALEQFAEEVKTVPRAGALPRLIVIPEVDLVVEDGVRPSSRPQGDGDGGDDDAVAVRES